MKKFEKVSMMVRVKPETRMILEEERLNSGQSFGQLVDNWAKIATNPKVWDFILSSVEKIGEELKIDENGKNSTVVS